MGTARSRMLRRRPASAHRAGARAQCGSTTTMMDAWTYLSAASWTSTSQKTFSAVMDQQTPGGTASRLRTSRCLAGSSTTTATVHLPTLARNPGLAGRRQKVGVWWRQTSITMDGWTFSSAMTRLRIFCSPTVARVGLRRLVRWAAWATTHLAWRDRGWVSMQRTMIRMAGSIYSSQMWITSLSRSFTTTKMNRLLMLRFRLALMP